MSNPTKAEIEAALAEGARRRREAIRASKPWLQAPAKARPRRAKLVKGEPVKARDTHRTLAKVVETTERPVPKAERKRVNRFPKLKAEIETVQALLTPKPVPTTTEPAKGLERGSLARQHWLEAARTWCVEHLATVGCVVPPGVRVSIGFPWKSRKAIGQCWQPASVTDEQGEILISPVMSDGVKIMATLIHELVHAATPGAKHGPAFARFAKAAGLVGKMTATSAGPELTEQLEAYVKAAGEYPAGAISVQALAARPTQTTRYKKAKCETCGYTCRVSRQWVNQVGAPHCPVHGEMGVNLG